MARQKSLKSLENPLWKLPSQHPSEPLQSLLEWRSEVLKLPAKQLRRGHNLGEVGRALAIRRLLHAKVWAAMGAQVKVAKGRALAIRRLLHAKVWAAMGALAKAIKAKERKVAVVAAAVGVELRQPL